MKFVPDLAKEATINVQKISNTLRKFFIFSNYKIHKQTDDKIQILDREVNFNMVIREIYYFLQNTQRNVKHLNININSGIIKIVKNTSSCGILFDNFKNGNGS